MIGLDFSTTVYAHVDFATAQTIMLTDPARMYVRESIMLQIG